MFIALLSGTILGLVIERGRTAYLACIPTSIVLMPLVAPADTNTPQSLFSSYWITTYLIQIAVAMFSVLIIRMRLGRRE